MSTTARPLVMATTGKDVAGPAEAHTNDSSLQQAKQGQPTKAKPVGASHPLSPLRWMTGGDPTNYNMLLFRTLNREMGLPSAHEDQLGPQLRDALMPLRCGWFKKAPNAWASFRKGLEHPKLGAPGVVNFVDARTRWFDEAVKQALRSSIKQVVIVAAGFDTRAYRFGRLVEGVPFFEVDLPVASHKKQVLVEKLFQPAEAYPRPHYIAANLAKTSLDEVLRSNSSFKMGAPTLFTVEGLVYYLPEAAVQQLLAAMARVAGPGSMVYFDFLHKSAVDGVRPLPPGYKVTAQSVANKGEPFLSGLVPQPHTLQAFLDSCSSRAATNATITHTEGTSGQTNSSTSSTGKAAGKPPMPVPVQPPSAAHHNTTNGTSNSVPTAAVPITTPGTGVAPAAAAPAGVELRWELSELLSPQQQLAASLPHIAWDDAVPPILSFYSFAAATLHPAST